jgi:arylsulfatase A-like enzyme/tetratricopeptide (TPR) repeat protein
MGVRTVQSSAMVGNGGAATARLGKREVLLLVVVALSAVAVYLNSLGGGFVWDDRRLILDDRAIKSWRELPQIFSHDFFERNEDDLPYGYYRPLTTVSYLLDYTLWGLQPFGYHLTNVSLHALCTVLMALILLRLRWPPLATAIATLLFAVHPIHTESVAWIAGRTDLLAFLFCGLTLLSYLSAEPRCEPLGATEGVGRRRRLAIALSLFSYALALLAKEMSVIVVGWLAVIDLAVDRRPWRAVSKRMVPYLAVSAAYVLWRFFVIRVPVPGDSAQQSLPIVVLSMAPTLVRYLGWMLLPIDLNAYVQNPYVSGPLDPRFFPSVLILTAVAVATYRLGQRSRQIGVAAAMLALSFVPVLNLVRVAAPVDMGDAMAERFCYFPSFPFAALTGYAVAAGLVRVKLRALRVVLAAGIAAMLALGSTATIARNRDWADEARFLTKTLQQSPSAVLLWANLAQHHLRDRNLVEASKAIATASALDASDHSVLAAQALWYVLDGHPEQAIPLQERFAAHVHRGKTAALNNLAYLYRITLQYDKAIEVIERLNARGNGYADVYFNAAEIYRARGRIAEAQAAYQQALDDRPSNLQIAAAYADFELQGAGPEAAEAIYRRLLAIYPDDPRILNNVALLHSHRGDMRGAFDLLDHVVQTHPEYVNARVNYAELLQSAGRFVEASAQLEAALQRVAGTPSEKLVADRLAALRSRPTTVRPPNAAAIGSPDHRVPSAVVLVTVDTLRADFVSFNGHQPQTTPFLDTLAQDAVVFSEAYAPSSWTAPSMASLFTGMAPSTHGVVTAIMDGNGRVLSQPALAASLTTLAETFKAAGYVTVGIPANLHLAAEFGFAQGFDYYAPADFCLANEVNSRVAIQLQRAFGPEWQTAWKRRPTFLWIHYFDPHAPYEAREPWISQYAPDFDRRPSDFPAGIHIREIKQRYPHPGRELADHLKPLYESEISYLDDAFRRLSERLGLVDDNVLLIVTADHGEEFLDHGDLEHGHSLYQELVHVPLFVRWPDQLPRGRRVETPVSLLDLYPTFVEMLGLEAPSAFDGESILALLREDTQTAPRVLYFELRSRGLAQNPHQLGVSLKGIREGEWKLIAADQARPVQLFDLTRDPSELIDVTAEHGEVVRRLQARLTSWLNTRRLPPPDAHPVPVADDSVRERMRALGYSQ